MTARSLVVAHSFVGDHSPGIVTINHMICSFMAKEMLPYLIIVAVVVTVVETRACERMLKAMVLLEVLVAQRYPLVVDIDSQAAFSKLQEDDKR